jgi:ABC-type glycerol-3-phosphate transport system substrate-binding protein
MVHLAVNRRGASRLATLALAGFAGLASSSIIPAVAQAEDLSFSVMQSGTYDKAAAEIAAEFKQKTGINVKISAFPWAVLRQNNTTDLISGTGQYDVMSGGYYLADVYSYFSPLTDYINKDHYGDGIIPGLMEPGRSEYLNGKQIGVPFGVDAYGLIYNKDLLQKAGVTPQFATWADVVAACKKIEAADKGVACFSHPTGNPEQIGAFFFSGYNGPFVTADGKYALDPAKATAAAQDIAALWKYLPEKGTALTFDEAAQLFQDQKVAMLIDWPSFVTGQLDADKSAVKGKWSMAKFPGAGFPWLSLWQLFLPATTQDKDAAWQWIKAYAGPTDAKRNLVDHNIGSVWSATYDDPQLKAKHANYWPVMLAGYSAAKNPPLSGEAQDDLTNTLQDVANGRVSAAEGIASVNTKWASIPVPAPLAQAAAAAGFTGH